MSASVSETSRPDIVATTAPPPLPVDTLAHALNIRDLTDPGEGDHAMQLLVEEATDALNSLWDPEVRLWRSRPVVAVEDNYDRLGYAPDAISRDARYTRYVSETTMLRSHTSAGIPPALRRLATEPPDRDVLMILPGISHRRDTIDRLHTGAPHQVDLWLIRRGGRRLDHDDLHDMVSALIATLLPGTHWRWTHSSHPYTSGGRQVDAVHGGGVVEIAECGLAAPGVLAGAGLDPARWSGLALGMGLDRMVMLRKGVPDIRLLRSGDPRVAAQMLDLSPYRPVSNLPPARRDISVATSQSVDVELLGDQIREALGDDADLVEEVCVLSRTPYDDLPDAARERLGMVPGQVNLLVRLELRPVDRTMTSGEANTLRDRIYAALHHGRRA